MFEQREHRIPINEAVDTIALSRAFITSITGGMKGMPISVSNFENLLRNFLATQPDLNDIMSGTMSNTPEYKKLLGILSDAQNNVNKALTQMMRGLTSLNPDAYPGAED